MLLFLSGQTLFIKKVNFSMYDGKFLKCNRVLFGMKFNKQILRVFLKSSYQINLFLVILNKKCKILSG